MTRYRSAMAQEERPAIRVTATGMAAARPDVVELALGVETRAVTPGEALTQAAAAAEALLRHIERRGVLPEDRQTTHVGVTAVFDHQRQVVGHHQASYRLKVKLPDVVAAGVLLNDAATEAELAEVLRVDSIAFSFTDSEPLLSAARANAVAAARRQAEELADAAGVVLGAVRSITEGDGNVAGRVVSKGVVMQAAAPLEAGTHQLAVQVSVTFDIAD